MNCPACQAEDCRPSRRWFFHDYLLGVTGLIPWRCNACDTRFHAHGFSFSRFFHAHCDICGNLELQRIGAENVPGALSTVGRWLGLPAFRCPPCRHKFFSVRPLLPAEKLAEITAQNSAAKY